MTELTIWPEEIRDAIERNVAAYSPATAREEVGRVLETGDGARSSAAIDAVVTAAAPTEVGARRVFG